MENPIFRLRCAASESGLGAIGSMGLDPMVKTTAHEQMDRTGMRTR